MAIISFTQANNVEAANIISAGDCGELLTYKGIVVKTYYAQYTKDNINYPAYCLDKTKQGVNNEISYSVSVEDAISDIKLWRIITNGYPYKTIEELRCSNKEEAFTATKQAIYCYIHGNNPNDYQPIGEAGIRTLKALNNILNNAEKSNETQISNSVKIIKEKDNFEIDSLEKEYVSKIYSIKAGTNIDNYTINLKQLESELPAGIKITNINNYPQNQFNSNEKFKILIPIKQLNQNSNFKIIVQTQINSKPVLYGKANDSTYQDYALTTASYQDVTGETTEIYYRNETKLKIIKQDESTKKRLENIEFNILDENKNIIYNYLKTNSNGEIIINNLLPGKYFIQETNTKDGYLLNEELIEINVLLNQELTITINNLFEEKPEIEITKDEISHTVVKKLPVTGM